MSKYKGNVIEKTCVNPKIPYFANLKKYLFELNGVNIETERLSNPVNLLVSNKGELRVLSILELRAIPSILLKTEKIY